MISPAARGAWRELDQKLRPFVAGRLRSAADVDDVVQDVFLRMQRNLSNLRDDERFGPWVYQVARSAIADHQRAAARHPLASGDAPELSTPDPQGEDDDEALVRTLSAYLAALVATLPSPYREALTLTELEGVTQKDAAAMLGISVSGMKSRVQRGREHLRLSLEECCKIALDVRGRVVACEPRPDGPRSNGCRCE